MPERDVYEFLRGLETGTKSIPGTYGDGPGAPFRKMIHNSSGGGPGSWGGLLQSILPGSDYDYQAQAGDLWRNSAVAACLRVFRANFPQPELQVRQVKGQVAGHGKDKIVSNHALINLFDRPNKAYDRFALWSSFVTAAVCDGNGYLMKVRSAAQIPVEMWWIPPWMLRPLWDTAGTDFITAYAYNVNGRTYLIRPSDIIHYRFGGNDPRNERMAMSELKAAAARTVCGLNEVDGYTASIMRNMGIVGTYIRPAFDGGRINEDDAITIKDQWRERTTGERRGDVFVNPGTFIIDKLGFSPEELSLDTIPARLEDQICALTGVSAMLAGLTSGAQHKTYNNVSEARRSFYEDTLIPMQAGVAECLEHQILDDVGIGDAATQEVAFSYDRIMCLTEDQDKVWIRAATAYEKGGIRRSEYRDIIGLEWDKADEVYFIQPVVPEVDPGAATADEEIDDIADQDESGRAETKTLAEGEQRPFFAAYRPDSRPMQVTTASPRLTPSLPVA